MVQEGLGHSCCWAMISYQMHKYFSPALYCSFNFITALSELCFGEYCHSVVMNCLQNIYSKDYSCANFTLAKHVNLIPPSVGKKVLLVLIVWSKIH